MLNLRINEDGAEVERVTNGISHWYKVDIQALVRVLNEAVLDIKEEDEVLTSPILPVGTLGFKEYKVQNSYVVIMYHEPRIAEITFETRTYEVGYPGLIYVCQVTNKILMSVYIYAVKDRIIKPDTELFRYPYFNAYSDGRICIGSNRIAVEEPWQLHKMPDIIAAMPANNGLPNSNQSGLRGDSLLKEVEKKPFPDEWLTPTNLKLKDLF